MTVKMKRCEAGHHYDPLLHSSCPYCGIPNLDIAPTRPRSVPDMDPTVARGLPSPQVGKMPEEGVTVGYYEKTLGLDPVVGWLVCAEGPDRGRDYRLHGERNFIGRAENMDVCIRGDEGISRENHAVITFDPRHQSFKLQPGESRGLTYLNGEAVDTPAALKAYDAIEMGESRLIFMPFCGENFKWEPKKPE